MTVVSRLSLTTKLGALFALVAMITFTGVGAYLYHSLAEKLEWRDDQELIGKIGVMRHLAAEKESSAEISRNPHSFRDAAASHDNLIVLLKDNNGNIILHTNSEQGDIPSIPIVSLALEATEDSIQVLKTSAGLTARSIGAQGVTRNGEPLNIIVARTTSDRMLILKSYYFEVWFASICGTLLAALSGFVLARRSLMPIRGMANQAKSITAHRLDTHLDSSKAPQELQELAFVFNEMLDRLNGSFQRLNQFSADLAHDFRTPLNNLMLQTQVALSQSRSVEDYQTLLISNTEEFERLSHMVDNMLFLARAENAHVELNKVELLCCLELERIAEYFEGIAEEAGVPLSVDATGIVYADVILFRRAVHNLIANAIKHAAMASTVHIYGASENGSTVIRVSNVGVGIDKGHIEHLFERFYRVDAARSNAATSTGLGLAIVQSIMSLHEGSVSVDSQNSVTTFSLIFPTKSK